MSALEDAEADCKRGNQKLHCVFAHEIRRVRRERWTDRSDTDGDR